MLLEILEGQEAYISAEKLQDKDYFMYPAYYGALQALINTVKQRRRWEGHQTDLADCGVTNIITFSAPRGGGKTSAMQSFAQAMDKPECFLSSGAEDCDVLRGADFLTLPLIIPSVLRPGQGILPVVLSRMYQLAKEVWEQKQHQSCSYGRSVLTEGEKSELLRLFQCCLDGINAIKSQDGTTMDLTRLHELNDGAVLRQNFYRLIQQLLKLADKPQGFLVLQLDDADSQVGEGYEMLEDIRKYLMLPNLIILMAADLTMLRTVVFKHHYAQFQNILERRLMDISAVKEVTEKYMDKLIPPLNVVHLPRLEQFVIQQGGSFRLRYIRDQGTIWEGEQDISFQSDVLAKIYRRTGLAFVSHATYQNSMIPTTLRGLKQLLEVLAHMQDIPEVKESDKRTAHKLADKVQEQAKIAGENLARFSDYFLHDWINVKITDNEDRAFLLRLPQSSVDDRLQMIRLRLEARGSETFACAADDYSYAAIAQYIEETSRRSRSQTDYLFFFAIRTILSLESHRSVWRQKAAAAARCKAKREQLLIFSLDPYTTGLADSFYIRSRYESLNASDMTIDMKRISVFSEKKSTIDAVLTHYLLSWRGERRGISYMQILSLFLCLGEPGVKKYVQDRSTARSVEAQQRLLYNAQETALFVAANWEVQRRLLVDWNIFIDDELDMQSGESPKGDNITTNIRRTFDIMDEELRGLNEGSIWTAGLNEGLLEAFRALCGGDIIEDLDFGAFFEELYDTFWKEQQREEQEKQEERSREQMKLRQERLNEQMMEQWMKKQMSKLFDQPSAEE